MSETQSPSQKKSTLKVRKTKKETPVSVTETPVETPVVPTPKLKKQKVVEPQEPESEATESSHEGLPEDQGEWSSSQILDAITEQRRIIREAEM